MKYFEVEVEISDTVHADISSKSLVKQMEYWRSEEVSDFLDRVIEVAKKKGVNSVVSKKTLQEEMIEEILLSVSDRLTISQAEDFANKIKRGD
ncbi:MAG: hypothetical protein RIE52_12095 [Balneola sp.]